MRSGTHALLLSVFLFALVGCAGFGIVATPDPRIKLQDAWDLFDRQDRPLPAERLIRQAIDIYQENNDQLGLAEAYKYYGLFFQSRAIEGKWNKFYRENGFLDKAATFDSRLAKSIEYLEMARKIFTEHNRFDALTNVTLNIGEAYFHMGDWQSACKAYDRSLENNRENLRRNPDAKVVLPAGFPTYADFLAPRKRMAECS